MRIILSFLFFTLMGCAENPRELEWHIQEDIVHFNKVYAESDLKPDALEFLYQPERIEEYVSFRSALVSRGVKSGYIFYFIDSTSLHASFLFVNKNCEMINVESFEEASFENCDKLDIDISQCDDLQRDFFADNFWTAIVVLEDGIVMQRLGRESSSLYEEMSTLDLFKEVALNCNRPQHD